MPWAQRRRSMSQSLQAESAGGSSKLGVMRRLERGEYRTVAGRFYGTPKEVWGFRAELGRGSPITVARRFLARNVELLGSKSDLKTLESTTTKVLHSAGATHVIFQQQLRGLRVHRAYVTVHIGKDGCAYLLKNRLVPREFAPQGVPERVRSAALAIERARRELSLSKREVQLASEVDQRWFPVEDQLRFAHKVRFVRPRRGEEWIVYVDAESGRVLSRYDNMAARRARARVFDPNPVISLGGYRAATTKKGKPRKNLDAAFRNVILRDLDDSGYLQGLRVTTKEMKTRIRRLGAPYEFGRDSYRDRRAFREVMAYHHIDRACRYVESLGYTGSKAIFGAPIPVDVSATRADNSYYSPEGRCLLFGTGDVDDAEDGETILHEFGHALQDAIVPDFGQSPQAAAIGEGFGDYWAASCFAHRKTREYETSVMTWDGVLLKDHDPPCVRRVDERLTFEDFEHEEDFEHDNGQIWSATLWEIRKAIGRKRSDRIIVESHFQLDGFTTFARAARAILDANRNLFENRDRKKLVRIFVRRGIAPVE